MKVHLSTHVRHYTGGAATVQAQGETLAEVFADLDRQFPGLRFRVIDEQGRIREHMKVFVGVERAGSLEEGTRGADEVHIIGAISGG